MDMKPAIDRSVREASDKVVGKDFLIEWKIVANEHAQRGNPILAAGQIVIGRGGDRSSDSGYGMVCLRKG